MNTVRLLNHLEVGGDDVETEANECDWCGFVHPLADECVLIYPFNATGQLILSPRGTSFEGFVASDDSMDRVGMCIWNT